MQIAGAVGRPGVAELQLERPLQPGGRRPEACQGPAAQVGLVLRRPIGEGEDGSLGFLYKHTRQAVWHEFDVAGGFDRN